MTLISTFTEEFTGTTLDTAKWATTVTNATVTQNDQLEINANATTGQRQAQVDTKAAYYRQFNNSSVTIKVTTPSATGVFTRFIVRSISLGTQVQMDVTDGVLNGRNNQTGSEVTTNLGTYNPSTMVWWRLRHNGTAVIAGYSANGLTWTESSIGNYTAPASDDAFIRLWYSDSLAGSLASTAYFDSINPPIGGPIATMPGSFASPQWTLGTGFAANATDSKRLDVAISAATTTLNATTNGWDLTASSFTWKNHFIPPASVMQTVISSDLSVELRDNGTLDTGYRVTRTAAGLWQFFKGASAVGSTFTDLSVRQNPWMRIREASGTTYMEYSPNGSTGWAQPTSNQNTTNYATITNIKMRIAPTAVADAGHWAIQEVNGATPPTISSDPSIFYMQGTVTAAAAALNTSPSAPTVSTGDLSLLVVSMKPSTAGVAPTCATPSGWTVVRALEGNGTLVAGSDTGSTWLAIYKREDSGYGAPTISTTGVDSMASFISVFRSSKVAAGGTWDLTQTTKGSDTSSGANLAITGDAGIDVAAGDVVLAIVGVAGNSGGPSAIVTAGMSGATLLQNNTPMHATVSTGTDSANTVTYSYVTAGFSTSAPSISYTNVSANTGHGVFIRLRDIIPPITTPPPTELAGGSDSAVFEKIREVTDTAGATDSIVFTLVRVVTDLAGSTDSIVGLPVYVDIDAEDNAGASDTVALATVKPLTDDSNSTDQVEFSSETFTSDSAGASDTASLNLEKLFTDDSGSSDETAIQHSGGTFFDTSDDSQATDAVEFNIGLSVSDTSEASDELAFTSEFVKLLDEENAGSTDSALLNFGRPVDLLEDAGSSDTLVFQAIKVATESCGASDSVQFLRDIVMSMSEDSGSSEVLWYELNVG